MVASNKCGAIAVGGQARVGVGLGGDHAAREATRFERLGGRLEEQLSTLQTLSQRLELACDRIAGSLPKTDSKGEAADAPHSHLHRLEAQLGFLGALVARVGGCVDRLEEL